MTAAVPTQTVDLVPTTLCPCEEAELLPQFTERLHTRSVRYDTAACRCLSRVTKR